LPGLGIAEFTGRVNGTELLPYALVAVNVKVAVPDPMGVPARMPVDAFKARPEGSAPPVTAQVMGVLPEADRLWE
jgi:hypothetical protein